MDKDRLVKLIAATLDAPLRPDAWYELLDQLVDYLGAVSGAVVVADPQHSERVAPFASRFMREEAFEMLRRFFEREDADDTAAYRAMLQIPSYKLYSELELFGVEERSHLPPSSYRDFQLQAFGVRERFGINLNNYVTESDLLLIHSAKPEGEDVQGFRGDLELIAPLIGKGLRLYRVFEALRRRFNAMLGAMDRLGLGVLLLMEDATVIQANNAARRIVEKADGLALDSAQRLYGSSPQSALDLRKAIAQACQTARLNGFFADRSITIERRSGGPAYLITIGPLVDSSGELEQGLGCAIAFIADPSETTPISTEGLTAIGKLTEAEAEVCQLLVNGVSTSEIAETRGVSIETVRNQIKSLMAKLRCQSRVDVVRLAVMTRLPIEDR